jgi:hypothetical protein
MMCRLGIVGLEDELKLVATSIWKVITYRTGIIKHHGVCVEAAGQAMGAPEGARRTATVSHGAVEGAEASLFIIPN